MSSVLTYYNDIEKSRGALVTPNDQLLLLNSLNHEEFAIKYCLEIFQVSNKDFYNELLKRQEKLYKLWKNSINYQKYSYLDFLIYILGYDKIQTNNLVSKTIITTSELPHVRFYNYYLMDWNIETQTKVIYDSDLNQFINPRSKIEIFEEDREASEEIKEIKSKVLLKERPLFFK